VLWVDGDPVDGEMGREESQDVRDDWREVWP
jgi:hypothetical protein